ncbi:MAG: hypothetical protein ACP5UM_07170 [Anaerolineae bacterium]
MHFRAIVAAVPLALLMAFLSFLLPIMPAAAVPVECLSNGDFAAGYGPDGLPVGWGRFHQGKGASARWTADFFPLDPGQTPGRPLLILSLLGRQGGMEPPRLGLRQTVQVVPGQAYRLSLQGTLRCAADGPLPSGCGYFPQWALVAGGESRPPREEAWHTVPLIPTGPGTWRVEHAQTLIPREPLVTLFVALAQVESPVAEWAGLALERISLVGPGAGE